ncbi:MAG: glycosyltransferase, partial [Candidatus Aenigmarchaeota archaeon]|nr:glycosyltransferase [Candidatus Aenigmarchaeota archaeon]
SASLVFTSTIWILKQPIKVLTAIPKVIVEPLKAREVFCPIFDFLKDLRSRLLSTFLLSLVSLGLIGIFVSFIRLLITTPAEASVGLFFAGISLFFGMIFFVYSLKYYLILAAVLGFSRHVGNGNGNNHNGNGNGKNFIFRFLGRSNGGNGFKQNGLNNHKESKIFYEFLKENNNGNGKKGHGFFRRFLSSGYNRSEKNGLNGNGNGDYTRLLSKIFRGNGLNGLNGNGKKRHSILSRLFGNNNHHSQGQTLLEKDLDRVALKRQPFVSIHLPFYNEKKVASRILTACTSMDYDNYEVIVVDDSSDETTQILEKWKKHPKVKIFHRDHRTGFKGGALRQAVAHMNPNTEFCIVFDADFIPYPDTIKLFLKYFNVVNGHSEDYKKSNIAAVQGYQWHVLNKSENWVTRGVRTEYSGSYV